MSSLIEDLRQEAHIIRTWGGNPRHCDLMRHAANELAAAKETIAVMQRGLDKEFEAGELFRDTAQRAQKEVEALKVDAEIGRELYRAAGELPEWFNVVVDMERGAATVKWYDSDGNDYEIDGADRSLAEQIKDAVDSAIEQDAARGEK